MGGAFGFIGRGCPTTWVTLMKTVGTCIKHCYITQRQHLLLRALLLLEGYQSRMAIRLDHIG